MDPAAILTAGCAALGFASANALSHRAASASGEGGSTRLVASLLRQPAWLGAQALSLACFGLYALALTLGPLTVVQPIIVANAVLAVPLRALMDRARPSAREWSAVCLASAALGLLLVASRSGSGSVPDLDAALLVTGAGVAATAAVVVPVLRRGGGGRVQAALLAAGVGVLFGLVGGLTKLTLDDVWDVPLPARWSLWSLLGMGLFGVALLQVAYRASRLSGSVPYLNATNVLVSMAFGAVVLGEWPSADAGALAGRLVAVAALVAALIVLGTESPQPPTPSKEFRRWKVCASSSSQSRSSRRSTESPTPFSGSSTTSRSAATPPT